jgi:hypothetical protein
VKIGAENKNKLITMAVLLAIAIPAAIYSLKPIFSGSQPASAAARPAAASAAQKKTGTPAFREANLDTTLRTDVLAASRKITYGGAKRNIFRMEEAAAPPVEKTVAPVVQQAQIGPQLPPPPPPPPAITLKYFGFSNKPGEPRKAFFLDGDEIFVAKEGDIISRHYKILQISNTSVMVEDVLNNNKQQIALTAPPTTG